MPEYGWKPHRVVLANRKLLSASCYWYIRQKQRGTVSSNSRFQTVLVQQFSANISLYHRQASTDVRNPQLQPVLMPSAVQCMRQTLFTALAGGKRCAPNLPTKSLPTKIARLKLSGKFPMDLRVIPLKIKIVLESNPLKSRILVRRLAVPSFPLHPALSNDVHIYIYIYIYIHIHTYIYIYI